MVASLLVSRRGGCRVQLTTRALVAHNAAGADALGAGGAVERLESLAEHGEPPARVAEDVERAAAVQPVEQGGAPGRFPARGVVEQQAVQAVRAGRADGKEIIRERGESVRRRPHSFGAVEEHLRRRAEGWRWQFGLFVGAPAPREAPVRGIAYIREELDPALAGTGNVHVLGVGGAHALADAFGLGQPDRALEGGEGGVGDQHGHHVEPFGDHPPVESPDDLAHLQCRPGPGNQQQGRRQAEEQVGTTTTQTQTSSRASP